MAGQGRRGGGRGGRGTRAGRSSTPGRRSTPSSRNDDDIPQVYHEMLSEVRQPALGPGLSAESSSAGRHAAKRRRVGDSTAARAVMVADDEVFGSWDQPEAGHDDGLLEATSKDKPVQTVYDVDASEESAMEWEDVNLEPQNAPTESHGQLPSSHADGSGPGESLQLTLGETHEKAKQKAVSRRKPATALEKKWRLDIHKVHLLCLLSHVQMRNSWCNDEEVQVLNGFPRVSLLFWGFFIGPS